MVQATVELRNDPRRTGTNILLTELLDVGKRDVQGNINLLFICDQYNWDVGRLQMATGLDVNTLHHHRVPF